MAYPFFFCSVWFALPRGFPHGAIPESSFFSTSALFSFLPVFALGYSFDRGLFLTIAYLIFSVILILFLMSNERQRLFVMGAAIGISLGGLCLGFMLRWSFFSFFTFVSDFIRYSDLVYGLPYPIEKARYALSLTLIAFFLFWTTHKVLVGLEENRRSFYLGHQRLFSPPIFWNLHCS